MDADQLDTIARLGPVATALAAIVALVVGLVAWRQRSRADRREEWWRRTQWAIDRSLSPDPAARVVGLDVLTLQASSSLAATEDLRLLRGIAVPRLPAVPGDVDPVLVQPDDETPTEEPPHPAQPTTATAVSAEDGNRTVPQPTGPTPATADPGPARADTADVVCVSWEQAAAARLRVVTDARLGEHTPAWTRRLAELRRADR